MRACIAIGVNSVVGAPSLPKLAAAASGADQFAAWARTQGFEAWALTDAKVPVTVLDIFSRIDAIVQAKNCTQLIVYFAGHGILKSADTEMWLLSGAAGDSNAAVNLVGSVRVARKCGIPHLVFISDACRSIATDPGLSEVTGSSIFPTVKIPRKPEVDIFYATMPGDVSWEVPAEEAVKRYDGIFTRCLLQGLGGGDVDLIESVPGDNGNSLSVVSSRTLKPWIEEKVPDSIWKVDIKLNQFPELRVESQRPKFLAQITAPPPAPPPSFSPSLTVGIIGSRSSGSVFSHPSERFDNVAVLAAPPPLRDLGSVLGYCARRLDDIIGLGIRTLHAVLPSHSRKMVVRSMERRPTIKLAARRQTRVPIGDTGRTVSVSRLDPTYVSEVAELLPAPPQAGFATGFSLIGASVRAAWVDGQPLDRSSLFAEAGHWHIRLDSHGHNPRSVLIQFHDGSGTCLAAISGCVGSITVESGRVANVSYTPSPGGQRFNEYSRHRQEIEERRAVAAAASKRGYFRVEPAEAGKYAESLRHFKWVDPTLGIYSAYAYAQSGLMDEVASVYDYMVRDGFVPFDVALLSGNFDPDRRVLIAPRCPMLTQGWSLLDETVPVSPAVREAARFLKPALWTTLTEKGVGVLASAL